MPAYEVLETVKYKYGEQKVKGNACIPPMSSHKLGNNMNEGVAQQRARGEADEKKHDPLQTFRVNRDGEEPDKGHEADYDDAEERVEVWHMYYCCMAGARRQGENGEGTPL